MEKRFEQIIQFLKVSKNNIWCVLKLNFEKNNKKTWKLERVVLLIGRHPSGGFNFCNISGGKCWLWTGCFSMAVLYDSRFWKKTWKLHKGNRKIIYLTNKNFINVSSKVGRLINDPWFSIFQTTTSCGYQTGPLIFRTIRL